MQLVVGRIGRPHGVRGEVTVEVRTDDVDRRFAAGATLETDPTERGPLTVVRARPHSGRLLVAFEEMTNREGAEAMRGTLLVADSTTSPASEDPDEFWDHDLVGLAAVTTAGTALGHVVEVMHLPGQDVLVIGAVGADGADGAEVMVPFVAAIVPEVDLANGRVVIDPPDGLLI
ncbi:MAG: rRNA processing protein RimM [Frankiaceae bacterium]|nr:rRNA processing protein RimM [Frankiaceae bacterium]